MPRPNRAVAAGAGALGALVVLGSVLLGASPASAHVTVHPGSVAAGSDDVELTFRVPNERDDANSVALQVFFPTDPPLLSVDVIPVPGWTAAVHTQNLAKPLDSDDGPVSQVVADVMWKATAGGIAPGQYEDFSVSAGSVPDHPGTVVFKALQTYSSGQIVRWVEVPVSGQPAPDTPAPVLTLTAPATASTSGGAATGHASRPASGSSDALAVAAVVVGAVDLVAVAGLAFLVVRRRQDGGRRATT